MMENAHYTDLFYRYSLLVCGFEVLSRNLSGVYFNIIHNDPDHQPVFIRLMDQYQILLDKGQVNTEQEVRNKILIDADLNLMTQLIIKIWYLGNIDSMLEDPNNRMPLRGGGYYFHHEALIWKIARAHPAGLTGGYYGYWAYKPED